MGTTLDFFVVEALDLGLAGEEPGLMWSLTRRPVQALDVLSLSSSI
jgi:hypothetical protein